MKKIKHIEDKNQKPYDIIGLSVLSLGILSGVVYSLLMKNQYPVQEVIYGLMMTGEQMKVWLAFRDAILIYSLQLSSLLFCLMFRETLGIAYLIIWLTTLGYGFTVSSLILIYGIKGIWMSLSFLGLPAVIILGTMVWLFSQKVKIQEKHRANLVAYALTVITVSIGTGFTNSCIQWVAEALWKMHFN